MCLETATFFESKMSLILKALTGLMVTVSVAIGAEPNYWGDLGNNSPFGGNVKVSATPAQTSQIELRGVLVEGQERWFDVYDVATKRSEWINEGTIGERYLVKSFDTVHDTLVLESQGQTVSVSLKSSNDPFTEDDHKDMYVFTGRGLSTPPAIATAPASKEVKRFVLIGQVIRHLRDLRTKAAQPAPGIGT